MAAPDRIAALAALDDPTRKALFELVSRSDTAIGRDAAAQALGVSRRVAAFHLDRLAAQGLVEVEFRRPPGRSGPGAGRPAKLYRRVVDELTVSVPQRRYELVGELLAGAVAQAVDSGAAVQPALERIAFEAGHELGAAAGDVLAALAAAGYEPHAAAPPPGDVADLAPGDAADTAPGGVAGATVGDAADGSALTLANCPFHRLARQFTALVCGVNLQLLRGVASGAGSARVAVLDPGPGRCCVRFLPAPT